MSAFSLELYLKNLFALLMAFIKFLKRKCFNQHINYDLCKLLADCSYYQEQYLGSEVIGVSYR